MSNWNITVDKILLGAADVIRDCGWWRDRQTQTGGHCVTMAINAAAVRLGLEDRDDPRREALTRMGFTSYADAMRWNDTPGRTVDEVIARLEGAVRADVRPVETADVA